MTRPVKELVLAPSAGKPNRIFESIYAGTTLETGEYKKPGLCDPLGVGVPFLSEAKGDAELDNMEWHYSNIVTTQHPLPENVRSQR